MKIIEGYKACVEHSPLAALLTGAATGTLLMSLAVAVYNLIHVYL